MTKFSVPWSFTKIFRVLSVVSTEPFTISFRNSITEYPRVRFVHLTDKFFQHYGCFLHCAACCSDVSLDYIPEEDPGEKFQGISRQELSIGLPWGVFPLISYHPEGQYITQNRPDIPSCGFVNPIDGSCSVHPSRPLSCQVELIKFSHLKDKGYIHKRPYGRGWNLTPLNGIRGDISCTFSNEMTPEAWDQLKDNDIPTFKRILSWANHFKIPTHLPQFIDHLYQVLETGKIEPLLISNE